MRNGDVSFWWASGGRGASRPPLPGSRRADVCIVGAGMTGLWSAYYLKRARPELDVVMLEREFAGFGASGRNGGWLSPHFAVPRARIAEQHGPEAVLALERAMQATVDEVVAVAEREGIEAAIHRGGIVEVARSAAQLARLREALGRERRWGLGEEDRRELTQGELVGRIRVRRAAGGAFTPCAARVHPARLVGGLAAAVERLGVVIHERTAVRRIVPGRAETDAGTVEAGVVICATEGFTAQLPGRRRDWLPLNSAMIVTEPLEAELWAQVGWAGEELLGDLAHAYMYAQRTADGRIALGGRGVPYRYGSRTDRAGRTQARTIRQLVGTLHDMFPALERVAIEHAWCGVLGVARDWSPAVRFDRRTGLGIAGGYVGSGVATTNLAGRTLRDLVLGVDSELTRLPWVGHGARRWEPEPLRWIGARLVYGLYRAADTLEARSGSTRTHPLALAANALSGR